MGYIEILIKIVQLIAAVISLWRMAGREAAVKVLDQSKQAVCDEKCELKRGAEGKL